MKYHARSFLISFLLHGLMIILAVIGSAVMCPYKKTIVLNFDLRKAAATVKNVEPEAPAPLIKHNPLHQAPRQSLKEKNLPN